MAEIPPKLAPEKSLIEYPSAFPIKVMGLQVEGFEAAMVAVARHFDPTFEATTVERRTSKAGKYLGLTLTVTATSRGPCTNALRQRASSHIKATESGPPDTAITSAGADRKSANSRLASRAETGD